MPTCWATLCSLGSCSPRSSRREPRGGARPRTLELDSRRRIFSFIVDRPGAYLREIHRELGGSMGALEYHLSELEKAALVRVEHAENKRFFPSTMDVRESRVLALLRQAPPRAFLLALIGHGEVSHASIMATTGLRSSTATYHASKLVDAGLITRERRGRESLYALVDEAWVLRLLIRHRSSFLDRVVDAFLDGFEGIGR